MERAQIVIFNGKGIFDIAVGATIGKESNNFKVFIFILSEYTLPDNLVSSNLICYSSFLFTTPSPIVLQTSSSRLFPS